MIGRMLGGRHLLQIIVSEPVDHKSSDDQTQGRYRVRVWRRRDASPNLGSAVPRRACGWKMSNLRTELNAKSASGNVPMHKVVGLTRGNRLTVEEVS